MINTFKSKDDQPICGVRCSKKDPNTIFVATTNEQICVYDIRATPTHVQTFHNPDVTEKPFMSLDLNCDETVLCVGTDPMLASESFLLLFDVRKYSPLATYTESHYGDICQVKFHPSKSNILATGSIDGLINVFNISESNEDDALQFSLNSESSVHTINWHSKPDMQINDTAFLSCITQSNDFILFDVEKQDMIFKTERDEITKLIKRKLSSETWLANCHSTANNEIFLLAGSNFTTGECFRSLTVHENSLKPRNNFIDNKQYVRCSLFNPKVGVPYYLLIKNLILLL